MAQRTHAMHGTYEVDADGGDVALCVGVVRKTQEQARLADAGIADQQKFEQVVAAQKVGRGARARPQVSPASAALKSAQLTYYSGFISSDFVVRAEPPKTSLRCLKMNKNRASARGVLRFALAPHTPRLRTSGVWEAAHTTCTRAARSAFCTSAVPKQQHYSQQQQ
jgi:hypothetical protein